LTVLLNMEALKQTFQRCKAQNRVSHSQNCPAIGNLSSRNKLLTRMPR
jgi:hypothetical protein